MSKPGNHLYPSSPLGESIEGAALLAVRSIGNRSLIIDEMVSAKPPFMARSLGHMAKNSSIHLVAMYFVMVEV